MQGGINVGELRGTECLNQYDLEVISLKRGRGAVICETDQGMMLLKECSVSENRIQFEEEILSCLKTKDGMDVDDYKRTVQGELLSLGVDGSRYLLKRWYAGGECDMRNQGDILSGVRQLARLHIKLREMRPTPLWDQKSVESVPVVTVFEKHNREFRRIRSYVKRRRNKTDFELLLTSSFESFYAQAARASEQMAALDQKACFYLCHGDYNNHHILMGENGIAITEFGNMHLDVQIWDLYHFMRKALEKHGWNIRLGKSMLEAYVQILPVEQEEWQYLSLLFLYPEKYWKQLNYYYNSNKAWIPERNVDKLKILIRQQEARCQFIQFLQLNSSFFQGNNL